VFHPESARIARLASGGRYGFAQSVFQLGGSFGTSMGRCWRLDRGAVGQPSIAWFSSIAFLAIVILWRIGAWYSADQREEIRVIERHPDCRIPGASGLGWWCWSRCCFQRQLYVSSLSSYYIFYLIDKCSSLDPGAQLYLFIFLAANAAGAFFGGPLGDRFGRKYIVWSRSSARCRSRWRCPMPALPRAPC